MKNKAWIKAGVFSMVLSCAQGMVVHEWGTFTTLNGSRGERVCWYQPQEDLVKLPGFVNQGALAFKAGFALASVRMETPVLYFYPEKSTHISVDAEFVNGSITETYPASLAFNKGMWNGMLLPPDDPAASALIPQVKKSAHQEPYEAARAVPDAWIFLADKVVPPVDPAAKAPPVIPPQQAEKFIFYRGVGEMAPQLIAQLDDAGKVTVMNYERHSFPFHVALKVTKGKACWQQLGALAAYESSDHLPVITAALDAPLRDIAEVENELVAVFEKNLTAQGLTAAEAAAMVATWRTTWFRESGTRVFSLVPQSWVDGVLPLKINPAPTAIKRVFVARLEILAPQQEAQLVALLNEKEAVNSDMVKRFESLELGRFSSGALNRATSIQTNRMNDAYAQIREVIRDRDKRTAVK